MALTMLIVMVLTSVALAQTPKDEKHWVSAWSSAMHTPLAFVPGQAVPGLENQTLRMIVRPTIAGKSLRHPGKYWRRSGKSWEWEGSTGTVLCRPEIQPEQVSKFTEL
jgi:hypothetical protein